MAAAGHYVTTIMFELEVLRGGKPIGTALVEAVDLAAAMRCAKSDARRDGLGKVEIGRVRRGDEIHYVLGAPTKGKLHGFTDTTKGYVLRSGEEW